MPLALSTRGYNFVHSCANFQKPLMPLAITPISGNFLEVVPSSFADSEKAIYDGGINQILYPPWLITIAGLISKRYV